MSKKIRHRQFKIGRLQFFFENAIYFNLETDFSLSFEIVTTMQKKILFWMSSLDPVLDHLLDPLFDSFFDSFLVLFRGAICGKTGKT